MIFMEKNKTKKVVIIGVGIIGFSIIKQLDHLQDKVKIIVVDQKYPPYFEDYINQQKEKQKISFIRRCSWSFLLYAGIMIETSQSVFIIGSLQPGYIFYQSRG